MRYRWRLRLRRLGIACAALAMMFVIARAQDRPAKTPDIHYTPTRHAIADAMLQMAQVSKADVVYDLGSGDGRIPIIAAQKYGALGIGVEIDPGLIEQSKMNARDAGVTDRVTFITGDLFTVDLSSATVVTLYLSPSVNALLENRLRALRAGTRIVSHDFPIGRWPPDATKQVDEAQLFLWRVR